MKRILSALFILCFSVAHAEMPDNQAMKDRAKAFIDQNYGQIQEQIAGYKKRITESAGYSDETCHKEIPDKSLYVFISSSMPMATLQAYAADIGISTLKRNLMQDGFSVEEVQALLNEFYANCRALESTVEKISSKCGYKYKKAKELR
jgi:hypothetical protein